MTARDKKEKKQPMQVNAETEMIHAKDAALILNCSVHTIYTLAEREAFPSMRLGPTMLRIPRQKFMQWIASSTKGDSDKKSA